MLSKEKLKRLKTNYKIGFGKSQSWCKSLKNRIEELEQKNFKLKIEVEDLEEYNAKANEFLDKYKKELENKGKETAEKILNEVGKVCGDYQWFKNLRKQFGVEIKE